MKKVSSLFFAVLLGSLSLFLLSLPVQAQYDSPTFQQLQQSANDGNSASNYYSNGSYDNEGARSSSGYNFDTPSSSPPAVDLRDAGDHPTPQLLRNPGE